MAKYFPQQNLPDSEKTQEWCDAWLDAIVDYMGHKGSYWNTSRYRDVVNYNLYNGKVNYEDFQYITEQYGQPYPAQLQNFPIITPKIDLLVGEELKRPLDYKVTTTNASAIVRKENYKVSLIMQRLLEDVHADIKQFANIDLDIDGEQLPIPDDIDAYMRYTYREMIEETAQDGLEYLVNSHGLRDLFAHGFRDLLVTGKEFYKVYIQGGDPMIRRVDPRNFVYDIPVDSDYLDDCMWAGEERWLTPNEILDEFNDYLDDAKVREIEKMRQIAGPDDLSHYNSEFEWVDYSREKGTRIRVVTAEWKSIRQLRFKISPNKFDEEKPFKKLIPDNYKVRKSDNIETRHVDDIWEATKIGGKILVQARRRPNQVRSVDNASKASLSYIGLVKNNTGGKCLSMVDLLKHIQVLYNIVMYHIELTLSRAGGKAVVYDVSQMPTGLGMDMQTVLYHIKNDGIIPINSKEEGQQAQTFNQFQQVDFTLSSSVQQLINLKMMLEQTAGQISGVSPQREGSVSQYEQVGNVQRSVVQSATITETWFYQHNQLKKRGFEKLCELMKICWAEGKKAGYFLGDGAYKFLNIFPDISLNDYGIYIGDSGKDNNIKVQVQQLAQSALQGGNISMLDVIKVLKADTMTEAEHVLEKGLEAIEKSQAQMQEQAMAQQQAEAQAEEAKQQHQIQLAEIEANSRIESAKIMAEGHVEVAEIKSQDSRDIADMKEKVSIDKKFLDDNAKEQMSKNKGVAK
jgi:hypothetical protein